MGVTFAPSSAQAAAAAPAPAPRAAHATPTSSLNSLVLFAFNLVCKRAVENAVGRYESGKAASVMAQKAADEARVNLNELGDRATREHVWPIDMPEFAAGAKLTAVLGRVGEAYIIVDATTSVGSPAARLGPSGRQAMMRALLAAPLSRQGGWKGVDAAHVAAAAEAEAAQGILASVAAALLGIGGGGGAGRRARQLPVPLP